MHNTFTNVHMTPFPHAAVRLIEASLKASIELSFPPLIAPYIRGLLTPLLSHFSVASESIFIPPLPPSFLEQADTTPDKKGSGSLPSVVLTLITHLPQTVAAKRIQEVLNSPEWERLPLDESTANPFNSSELFCHREHRAILPLVSVTSAQLGFSLEESLQVTLICSTHQVYIDTVNFYKLVLDESDPASQKSYSRFSLKHTPTSNLELCIYESSSLTVTSISTFSLYVYVANLVAVVMKLVQECDCVFRELGEGLWLTSDPAGHQVVLHDKKQMMVASQQL